MIFTAFQIVPSAYINADYRAICYWTFALITLVSYLIDIVFFVKRQKDLIEFPLDKIVLGIDREKGKFDPLTEPKFFTKWEKVMNEIENI